MKKPGFFEKNLPESPFFYLSLGIVLCIGLFYSFFGSMQPPKGIETVIDRLAFTLQWHSLTALFILYCVFRITMIRLMAASVSVQDAEKGKSLEEQLRTNYEILSTSLEQSFVFVLASLGAATVVTLENFKAIPICIILFFIGRALYFYGYVRHPRYRAVGTPFSFIINGGMLYVVLEHLISLDFFG